MTTLAIRFLTGRYVAAKFEDNSQAEWPPHPGRVFMALAASFFEGGQDPEERAALEWLEAQAAPEIEAGAAWERKGQTPYVPVNDDHGGIVSRSKQDRNFPSLRLDCEMVYLRYSAEPPSEIRQALVRIAGRVTRIGHSSSLAQVTLVDRPEFRPMLEPKPYGAKRLRIARPGYLRYLESVFNAEEFHAYFELQEQIAQSKGAALKRLKAEFKERFPVPPLSERPGAAHWQGYDTPAEETEDAQIVDSPFAADFLILAKQGDGAALALGATLQLTGALRDLVMKNTTQPPPAWISGHNPDGSPCQFPHAAFFALPFVGSPYADGHLMGVGIALPRELHGEVDRAAGIRKALGPVFLDAGGQERELELWPKGQSRGEAKHLWRWIVKRSSGSMASQTLRQSTWTGPSQDWASVTPVVLHHYPKKKEEQDLARIVLEAIRSAMLPEPERLEISPIPFVSGAVHARNMPPYTEGGANLCRYQTHVRLHWKQPIRGPVLIGRGRYRGYGLLRPIAGPVGSIAPQRESE